MIDDLVLARAAHVLAIVHWIGGVGYFWWMAAMFGLWAIFMVVVFVLEPLLNDRIEAFARKNPETALRRLLRLHIVLPTVAAVTVLGAVAGSHGVYF